MRLSRYTDYAMRILFYLASKPDQLATVAQIAKTYDISKHHLVKIVQDLVKFGYVQSTKGRGGGMKLAMRAEDIKLGQIIRKTEADLQLVDCIGCHIASACALPGPLHKAVAAFIHILDGYSLHDIVTASPDIAGLLNLKQI